MKGRNDLGDEKFSKADVRGVKGYTSTWYYKYFKSMQLCGRQLSSI